MKRALLLIASMLLAASASAENLPCIGAQCYDSGSSSTAIVVNRSLNLDVSPYYVYTDDGSIAGPYTTCPLAIAEALRPYNTGSDYNTHTKISGTCTVTDTETIPIVYDDTLTGSVGTADGTLNDSSNTIPYRYIIGFIPTSVANHTALGYPAVDGTYNTTVGNGLITWNDAEIVYQCTGQTANTVIAAFGAGWVSGHGTGTADPATGYFLYGPTMDGQLTIRGDLDCDDGTTARPALTLLESDGSKLMDQATSTIGVMFDGWMRSDTSNLILNVKMNATDEDDVAVFARHSNGNAMPKMRMTGAAIGFLGVGFHTSSFPSAYINTNNIGVAFGDPVLGADIPQFVDCVAENLIATACATRTKAFNGGTFSDWRAENQTQGPQFVEHALDLATFYGGQFEGGGTETSDEIMFGPGYCTDNGAGNRPGFLETSSAECTAAGGAATACPTNRNFGTVSFIGTTLAGDKGTNGTPDGIDIGRCAQAGNINISGSIIGSTTTGGVARAWSFDSVSLGGGQRPTINITDSTIENSVLPPSGYNSFRIGRVGQVAAQPTTSPTGRPGDLLQDTASSVIYACVTTDGVCNTAAEWIPQGSRSRRWGAENMLADGTECSNPAAVTPVASGPIVYAITCAMGTAETDGYIYGMTQLPSVFDAAGDATFTLSSEIVTDGGAGTANGYIEIQCVAANATISSTWGAGANLDIGEIAGDVVQDVIQSTSSTVDLATCTANDQLFWRFKLCDTDATPSSGCSSSNGYENDFRFIGMRMN